MSSIIFDKFSDLNFWEYSHDCLFILIDNLNILAEIFVLIEDLFIDSNSSFIFLLKNLDLIIVSSVNHTASLPFPLVAILSSHGIIIVFFFKEDVLELFQFRGGLL